jgi:hypothetical protein
MAQGDGPWTWDYPFTLTDFRINLTYDTQKHNHSLKIATPARRCSEHGPIYHLFELILVIHANTSNGTNHIV